MHAPNDWDEEAYETALRGSALQEPLTSLGLRPAICVPPDTSVRQAVRLMNDQRIGAVLVTAQKRLVGIFTERDVLSKLVGTDRSLDAPVRDLMTETPSCLDSDDAIVFALKLMHEGGFRHVPLLDDAGYPVAVVSIKDVVELVVGLFEAELATAPPASSHLRPPTSEGA